MTMPSIRAMKSTTPYQAFLEVLLYRIARVPLFLLDDPFMKQLIEQNILEEVEDERNARFATLIPGENFGLYEVQYKDFV